MSVEMNGVVTSIPGVDRLTFLDSNFSPGSVMLLFELTNGLVHLYTG